MNKLDGDLKLVKGCGKFLQNFVVFIYFCNEYNSEECFVSFWEIIFQRMMYYYGKQRLFVLELLLEMFNFNVFGY